MIYLRVNNFFDKRRNGTEQAKPQAKEKDWLFGKVSDKFGTMDFNVYICERRINL